MTDFFPARLAFQRDPDATRTHSRVYAYACDHFDFAVPTWRSLDAIAAETGLRAPHISQALTWLAARGYLTEWPREEQGRRRFTLFWPAPSKVTKTVTDSPAKAG